MSDAEHWERRYREGDSPWDSGRPSTELQRVLAEEKIDPCRCIELGCGTGTNAVWLAQQGFDVTGVDISPLAIDRARERAAAAGVAVCWRVADVLDPPNLGEPYGFFFDRGCYHVVRRDDVHSFLRTLDRITEPGTLGLVLTGNAREPRDPGPPVVDEETLRQELGQLFQIVWLREFRFDSAPGSGESFLAWSCLLRREALVSDPQP
jgi:2-polyprenyl-3-methyl-5-hydroxy-6-metoxy-1,4-benzoquinol methylase